MPKYKNIRVKKPNGGYRTQRVQVLKSGKYKFVKNPTGPARKRRTPKAIRARRPYRQTRRRTSVARRRKKGGRRRKGVNILPLIGLAVGTFSTFKAASDVYKSSPQAAANIVMESMIGWYPGSPGFNWKNMRFTLPVAAGCIGSVIASKTGINRKLPRGINL